MKNIDLAPDQAGFKGDLNVPKYCFVLEIALLTGRNKNRLNLPHCMIGTKESYRQDLNLVSYCYGF